MMGCNSLSIVGIKGVNGGRLLILLKDLFKVFRKCTVAKTIMTAG